MKTIKYILAVLTLVMIPLHSNAQEEQSKNTALLEIEAALSTDIQAMKLSKCSSDKLYLLEFSVNKVINGTYSDKKITISYACLQEAMKEKRFKKGDSYTLLLQKNKNNTYGIVE